MSFLVADVALGIGVALEVPLAAGGAGTLIAHHGKPACLLALGLALATLAALADLAAIH